MIIGLFLRNYKCYKGINYISFFSKEPKNLKVIIGNNGVGKSSILEALNTFFNDTEWTVNSESKENDSFVGGLFLMSKAKVDAILASDPLIEIMSHISSSFWNVSMSANANYSKYEEFFRTRDKISHTANSHYLFMLGKEYNNKDLTFLTFKNSVNEEISKLESKPTIVTLNILRDKILDHFSYLYIPVETSISEFLKLEATGMQTLMNKDIKNNISQIFNTKNLTRNDENRTRSRQYSFLDVINQNLEDYISLVEEKIQKIDSDYNFKKGYRQNTNLTANHITDVILNAYYSKRKLKKGDKPINTLSAGERKRALVDIAYSLLSQSNNNSKEIILAIDEPESSLHISKCYEQFSRIEDIANVFSKSVFISTHWYGSLPILNDGVILHIEKNEQIKTFDISYYFEQRREHPDDIHLKSYFDLASSIISSLRNSSINWLLVEGYEDKIYLDYYIKNNDIKILPLGGCANVKTIYEYLFVPMSKKDENSKTNGKVFCLVDTDTQAISINVNSETKNNSLKIRRLHEESGNVSLLRIGDPNRTQIEIEEVLDPHTFYITLSQAIAVFGSTEENKAFSAFKFDPDIKNSKIIGDNSILQHLGNGRNLRADKSLIIEFINSHKRSISEIYITQDPNHITPNWISEIVDFFTNKNIK